jgi:hypothetical protein
MASDVTRHYLSLNHEPAREDSRLFEDLQQFALAALESVRSGEFAAPVAFLDRGVAEGRRGHTQ